jgi:hypothetical protein
LESPGFLWHINETFVLNRSEGKGSYFIAEVPPTQRALHGSAVAVQRLAVAMELGKNPHLLALSITKPTPDIIKAFTATEFNKIFSG